MQSLSEISSCAWKLTSFLCPQLSQPHGAINSLHVTGISLAVMLLPSLQNIRRLNHSGESELENWEPCSNYWNLFCKYTYIQTMKGGFGIALPRIMIRGLFLVCKIELRVERMFCNHQSRNMVSTKYHLRDIQFPHTYKA